MRIPSLILFAGLAAVVGCGSGPKLAPVSGRVMVDGKPYPNAYVMFQPLGTADNPNPGRGSMAITDAEGRFVLKYEGGLDGAVVGKHIVRISSVQPADLGKTDTGTEDTGSPDGEVGAPTPGFKPEVIPPDWNTDSKREFTVPPEGTDQANFDITSIKAAKKGGRK